MTPLARTATRGTTLASAALIVAGTLVSEPAHALEAYMFGVGPRIGTTVLPGRYPLDLPKKVKEQDWDEDGERDLDEDGNPIETSIERVRTDIFFGADAVYYVDRHSRIGALLGAGFGKRYSDFHFIARYNYVVGTGSVDFFFGGGIGVGTQGYRGAEGDERMKIAYYPIRAETSALVRDNWRGYQATIFGQWNLPGNHNYLDATGTEQPIRSNPLTYIQLGVELTVYFGDFTPPRPTRRGSNSG